MALSTYQKERIDEGIDDFELVAPADRYRLGLTRREKEFLATLKLTNQQAIIKQQRIAFRLHYLNRNGFWAGKEYIGTKLAPQDNKTEESAKNIPEGAVKARKRADLDKAIAAAKQAGLPEDYIEDLNEIKNVGNFLDTATPKLHALLTWYTSLRLFILRLDRVIQHAANLANGLLPGFYTFLALSYIPEFLLHLTEIIRHLAFYETQAHERDLLEQKKYFQFYWRRFQEIIMEDGRLRAMANAFVWSLISIAGIVITITLGPVGALIASDVILLAGFAFDVIPAVVESVVKLAPMWSAYRKICNQLDTCAEQLSILSVNAADLASNSNHLKQILAIAESEGVQLHSQDTITNEEIKTLQDKITAKRTALQDFKTQARKEAAIATTLAVWDVAITVTVLTGMVLLVTAGILAIGALALTPPGLGVIAGLGLAGALLAFVGGSCVGGFGKRIATNIVTGIYNWATKKKVVAPEEQPLLQPQHQVTNIVGSSATVFNRISKHSKSAAATNSAVLQASNESPSNSTAPRPSEVLQSVDTATDTDSDTDTVHISEEPTVSPATSLTP